MKNYECRMKNEGVKKLILVLVGLSLCAAFADRTASREWTGRNFAPLNLVPRVEALESNPVPTKWATGNLTNANGVGLVALKDSPLPGDMVWTQSSITSGRYQCIAFGNGTFVAGGYDKQGIVYSTDGVTWHPSSITTKNIENLGFGGGRFVAAVQSEGIWYSEDNGATWTQSSMKGGNGFGFAYGNGLFIAAGYSGSGIHVSTDGVTWESSSITGGYWRMSAYGNGVFLVAGNRSGQGVQYSTDGRNWTRVESLDPAWGSAALAYGGGRFAVEIQGGRGLYCSTDGLAWTQTTSYVSGSSDQKSLTYGSGRFLNGANYGLQDGETTWRKVGNGKGWSALAYGNGMFVGGTFSSSQGLWVSVVRDVPLVQGIRVNGTVLTPDGDNVVDLPVNALKAALGID